MDATCLGDASLVMARIARGIIHSLVPLCSTEAPCIIFRALVRRLLRADFEIWRGGSRAPPGAPQVRHQQGFDQHQHG